jgi:hypothetical protein
MVEAAYRVAHPKAERLASFAAALFERASLSRPVRSGVQRGEADQRWAMIASALEDPMVKRGLSLELAAAELGISLDRILQRERLDPVFAKAVDGYRARGSARVVGELHARAIEGKSDRMLELVATHIHARHVPRPVQRTSVEAPDIYQSAAWAEVKRRLLAVLCDECRERVEGMGNGSGR